MSEQQSADQEANRKRLETMRSSVMSRRNALGKHIKNRDVPLPADFAEQATELENDEAMVAIERELNIELQNLNIALSRIEAGTYGQCASCAEPIQSGRLEALPEAVLCVRCAEAGEAAPRA